MKKTILLASVLNLALLGATITPAFAGPGEEAEAAFAAWRSALTGGKADAIVALYADNAVLLPTLSPDVKLTQAARMEYFEKLTKHPKLAAVVTQSHTQVLDDNNVVLSGLYTFSYDEAGKKAEIPARFTFVYEKQGDRWVIVEHHSSRVPAAK